MPEVTILPRQALPLSITIIIELSEPSLLKDVPMGRGRQGIAGNGDASQIGKEGTVRMGFSLCRAPA